MMRAPHRLLLSHLLTCLGLHALGSEIINGKNAPKKSMLYMASVQNDKGHLCGGFLINEHFVLTAAHCDKDKPTRVVLGTHDLNKVDQNMIYGVKRCMIQPFKDVSKGDDIMLLKLSRKVKLDKIVQPIKLPQASIKLKDKAKCQVAGWGLTQTGGKGSDVLQVVDVPVINLGTCKRQWSDIKVNLPANVICAGGFGTDKGFCQGDSGGPLVCNRKAVGIVSFNMRKNCDYPNMPNVYTDISKYLSRIKKILKKNNC